jgi:anaerobic selenocysteine-containing dehydrogenase
LATDVATFCPLCVSRCGATATVDEGRLVALRPLPGHPTGQAICVKGKAAPEIVAHPDRLLYPLRRTTPKGAADPGWERLSWEEALATIADGLVLVRRLGTRHKRRCHTTSTRSGPHSCPCAHRSG